MTLILIKACSQTTQETRSLMMPPGPFDRQNRFEKLDKNGDPLVKLNKVIQWESFREALENIRVREKKPMREQSPRILC